MQKSSFTLTSYIFNGRLRIPCCSEIRGINNRFFAVDSEDRSDFYAESNAADHFERKYFCCADKHETGRFSEYKAAVCQHMSSSQELVTT